MSSHNGCDVKKLRYVYILDIDNRGSKSKFFGHKRLLYVGQTDNIKRRLFEHLSSVNSSFLSKNFCDSRKNLVFVGYVFGTEYDSIDYELKIKKMSRSKKLSLIYSDKNFLFSYVPFKVIILRNYDCEGQTAIKL